MYHIVAKYLLHLVYLRPQFWITKGDSSTQQVGVTSKVLGAKTEWLKYIICA